MSLAFKLKSSCPVPSISAIDGSLVSSCEVLPAPDPICEFPIFDSVPVVPPGFTFGCYQAKIATGIIPVGSNGQKAFNAGIAFPHKDDTGFCEPEFQFSIQFPCYKIHVHSQVLGVVFLSGFGTGSVSGGASSGASAELQDLFKVEVSYSNSSDTGVCEPTLDFKIRFPCTNIKIKVRLLHFVLPSQPLKMSIQKLLNPETCEQEFRIFMKIPCASLNEAECITQFNSDFTSKATLSWILIEPNDAAGDSLACLYDSIFTLWLPCAVSSDFIVICSADLVNLGGGSYSLTLWRRSLSFSCGYLVGAGACIEDS